MKSEFTPKLFSLLKGYNRTTLLADVLAGIGVGIVALPVAIAFGVSSGVSPEEGLVTAIIGCFIVSLLGGSSVQISGPTGAFIVIVTGVISKFGIQGLLISTFMAGIMLMLWGILRLGTIIKFIPYPIIVGFTSGIAVILLATQAQDFLGLPRDVLVPAEFLGKCGVIFENISRTNIWAVVVGVLTIMISVGSSKVTKKIPGSLIAITLITILVYLLSEKLGFFDVETLGDRFAIKSSFPKPEGLDISLATINKLLPSAFTIAFLGAIESLLTATVADGVTGDKNNSNMELIAQGAANAVVPFFGGIPVTGAIARTMTNITNGAKTPVSGIVHSILLLGVLLFFMPLVQYIPMASLAGVLVIVAYNMSEWRTFKSMVSAKTSDALVLVITFVLTIILDITIAIEMGLLLAALLFMRRISGTSSISLNTETLQTSNGEDLDIPKGVEVYEIDGPFFFGMANKFEAVMLRNREEKPSVRIIRMRKVPLIDATGIHNLEILLKRSVKDGIRVVLSGVNEDVEKSLKTSQLISTCLKPEDICPNINSAIERARELGI